MFKLNTLLALVCCFICNQAIPQISRKAAPNSVKYINDYQRFSTSSVSYHCFEIKQGRLYGWGFNFFGQIGDSSNIQRYEPVPIGVNNNWQIVSAGYYHSLAIQTNGTLWAWGNNSYGQLGDGTFIQRQVPTQIGSDSTWVSVCAGEFHSAGIKANGTLWTWGDNAYKQLGHGDLLTKNIPTQVGTEKNWVKVIVGSGYTVALKADGTIWNLRGNTLSFVPVIIPSEGKTTMLAGGYGHFFAVQSNGTLWGAGLNDSNQLALGDSFVYQSLSKIGNDTDWVSVSAGRFHSMALKANGTLWVWGSNGSGQLGNTSFSVLKTPTLLNTDSDWVAIQAGYQHSMAVKANGSLMAWGNATYGQMGVFMFSDQTEPLLISKENVWLQAIGGRNHSLGLRTDGSLWSWGQNVFGQLGIGNNNNELKPVLVDSVSKWIGLSAGGYHSLALKSNGTIWGSGYNGYGQLGIGDLLNKPYFVQVGTQHDWRYIAAGELNSFAIKTNGTLWAWGQNGNGELGIGSFVSQNSPTLVGTSHDWVAVSGGIMHAIALKSNGTIWTWGNNYFGQLGDTLEPYRTMPHQVGADNDWVAVFAGDYFNLALKSNGTIWSWGYNNRGQLGIGDSLTNPFPKLVNTDNDWITLSAGGFNAMALKANGNFFAWGANGNGELGDGTIVSQKSPVLIKSNSNLVSLDGGGAHCFVLGASRLEFCASGTNNYGQLGNSTINNSTQFICSGSCYLPPAPLVANSFICKGTSSKLSALGLGSISWYGSENNYDLLASGSFFETPKLDSSQTYYVQDSTCDVSVRWPVSVFVLQKPNIGLTINDAVQCQNNNHFVFVDTSNTAFGTLNRVWFFENGDSLNGAVVNKTFLQAKNESVKLLVYYNENNTCKDSIFQPFQVKPKPQVSILTSNREVCMGNSVVLKGAGANTYQWNKNVEDGMLFYPNQSGYYQVIGSDSFNCTDTSTIFINVFAKPKVVALASKNSICAQSSLILSGNGAKNYIWNNGVINNEPFVPSSSNFYQVIGIDSNNCIDSATVWVEVKPLPSVLVTQNKNILTALETDASFQWLNCDLGKTPINEYTNFRFEATKNGNYAVAVTKNGCVDTSNCFQINTVSIPKSGYLPPLTFFPNPSNGKIFVESIKSHKCQIINTLGQVVYVFETTENTQLQSIDLTFLQAGVYYITSQTWPELFLLKLVRY
jgi:alpha-tubulin suppressor-like RCC1 family protein